MRITKTDYLNYLQCPEFAWLQKHKPDAVDTTPSEYDKKLIRDGYEVEEYAQKLFPSGKEVTEEFGENQLPESETCLFQPTFITDSGLKTRCDILQGNGGGTFDLFEVKSSSRVKQQSDDDHIRDIAFQKIVLEKCGCNIQNTYIIHLNSDYIREDELELDELFVIADVSDRVNKIMDQVRKEIREAGSFLNQDSLDVEHCSCRYDTQTNHCDAFNYFNASVENDSVYNLPYLRKKKLKRFLDQEIESMTEIPESFDLSDRQYMCMQAAKTGKPQIDKVEINSYLSNYNYPLYFLDYETYNTAIPKIEGSSPHTHVTFQVSLHVLSTSGDLTHHEYLSNELSHPNGLVDYLKEKIGKEGSIVVWHESFEKKCNKSMAERFPGHANFLHDMNSRIVDLKNIFQKGYVHPDAGGSASIKDVLPALLPDFSYEDLEIQDGTMAMQAWEQMVTSDLTESQLQQRRQELLNYCELDTLAMVELYRYVQGIMD